MMYFQQRSFSKFFFKANIAMAFRRRGLRVVRIQMGFSQIFKTIISQKFFIFFCKSFDPMMIFLVVNVIPNNIQFNFAD